MLWRFFFHVKTTTTKDIASIRDNTCTSVWLLSDTAHQEDKWDQEYKKHYFPHIRLLPLFPDGFTEREQYLAKRFANYGGMHTFCFFPSVHTHTQQINRDADISEVRSKMRNKN